MHCDSNMQMHCQKCRHMLLMSRVAVLVFMCRTVLALESSRARTYQHGAEDETVECKHFNKIPSTLSRTT